MKIHSLNAYAPQKSKQNNGSKNYASIPVTKMNSTSQKDTVSFGSRFEDEAETLAQNEKEIGRAHV